MKKINWAALAALLSLLLVAGIGCDNEKSSEPGGGGTGGESIAAVTIDVQNDTLRFLPGDSASTGITIIVNDNNGNVVPNQHVSIVLGNPQLGFIEFVDTELRDTTNALGRVNVIFTAISTAGNNILSATAGGITSAVDLVIQEAEPNLGTLSLSVTPDQLFAPEGQEEIADVKVVIADINGNVISGFNPMISATGGRLAPLPASNDSGICRTKWFSNDEFGSFDIIVSAGNLTRTKSVEVVRLDNEFGTLEVTSERNTISADNCITTSRITAILKDRNGEAITNDTIRFGTPRGGSVSLPFALTDGQGRAQVEFCEFSVPNDPETQDSSIVIARYEPWELRDTVAVWIDPAQGIGLVEITVGSDLGVACQDSFAINLNARFEDGSPLSGYYAHFTRFPCGSFSHDSLRITNGSLDSTAYYYPCRQIPVGIDVPWIQVRVGSMLSNQIVFDLQPGSSYAIFLDAPLNVNVNQQQTLFATVVDTFGNRVGNGRSVQWTSDLGSIGAISQTVDGVATTNFNPGTEAGQATITASSGTATDDALVEILSGIANTITLTVSEPSLEVAGTGGTEWTQLRAMVADANGNPVPDGTWVVFRILIAPPGGGTNINDNGLVDSTQTANGLAVATLNAGSTPGPVQISACTIDENVGDYICVQHTGINIVAGPPANIFIFPDEIGESGGASDWNVEVSALVVDAQQNPVRNGTAVYFEVFPPQTAQILSRNVVTGNEDVNGDTREGVAYTTMRYLSPQTFNTVTITARTADDNNTSQSVEFVLPLQDGFLDLVCSPSQWHFVEDGDPCSINCTAIIQDGHDTQIDGALVYFSTQRGSFFMNPQGAGPDTSFAVSGPPGGNQNGFATLYLVSLATFIFPDPFQPEQTAQVSAEVVGYSGANDSQTINFRRGQGR